MFDYNNENLDAVKKQLDYFSANFGGTNIYEPVQSAFLANIETGYKKRIFLLTDGQVGNVTSIVKMIADQCKKADDTKVFSFGMGENCSRHLITESANAGKGKYYFVENDDEIEMKEQVIDALQKAAEPALINCKFDFGLK